MRYYAVGRERDRAARATRRPARWRLRSNGLPESLDRRARRSLRRAGTSTRWLGGAARRCCAPTPREHRLGRARRRRASSEAIPGRVERIDVIELEPEVVAANRALAPQRARDPLADPRVRVVENDARSALLLSDQRFDAIVAQASHPWTAGVVASLHARVLRAGATRGSRSGGVFVQWMGAAFIDEELLRDPRGHAASRSGPTCASTDRSAATCCSPRRTRRSRTPRPSGSAASSRAIPSALAALGVLSPAHARARAAARRAGAAEFARGAPLNTDDRNLLQMRSPRVVAERRSLVHRPSQRLARLAPARQLTGDGLLRIAARSIEQGLVARAVPLLPRLESADDRLALASAAALARGRRDVAKRTLARLLTRSPSHERARALGLGIVRSEGPSPALEAALRAGAAGDAEQTAAAARAAEAAEDWAALGSLEGALARIDAESPFHLDARLLRAAWRARTKDAAARAEARTLLTGVLVTSRGATEARLLLAELERGDAVRVAAPLLRIVGDPTTPPLTAREAEQLDALARALPSDDEELSDARRRILAFLERAPRASGR